VAIIQMLGDESSTADAAYDGPIVDQLLESLAYREEIAAMRNRQVSFRRNLCADWQGAGELPDLGLDPLVLELRRMNFHKQTGLKIASQMVRTWWSYYIAIFDKNASPEYSINSVRNTQLLDSNGIDRFSEAVTMQWNSIG
jgi:hypothetical protein